ncbi:hypothetical protein LZ30DRAFT_690948 [Colletotrichum cereale]|nr:hypothetical protein LZ30DRAFT_690948 [Colletotrichum cereale]
MPNTRHNSTAPKLHSRMNTPTILSWPPGSASSCETTYAERYRATRANHSRPSSLTIPCHLLFWAGRPYLDASRQDTPTKPTRIPCDEALVPQQQSLFNDG